MSNPLGHDERFQVTSVLLSRAYPDASWAHARRKFFELADIEAAARQRARKKVAVIAPLALEAVRRMDELFAIEREVNGRPAADFGLRAARERNILLFMFTDEEARRLFGAGWGEEARRMLSLFRATHDLWPGDPSFDEMVKRLRAGCSEFEPWWADHDVAMPRSGSKRLHLRSGATVVYEYSTFQANDDPSLKLALYVERR